MSYFSDASLVFIPSAQKSGKAYSIKPTDGTGDLTFTRTGATATRVASNGLIERVRTNLALYSEDQTNAAWSKTNVSVTGDTTANPVNGATTADTFTITTQTTVQGLSQSFTADGSIYTISVFLKKEATSKTITLRIRDAIGSGTTYATADLNLNTGVVSAVSGVASVVDYDANWWRLIVTTSTAPVAGTRSIVLRVANVAVSETFTVFGAMLEKGDIATDYIATTSAAVSVGPVANVPRLDYLNSSCPRLLLEPQRTNLCVNSENLDNAVWTKVNSTVTANNTTAPDGYLGADRINEDTANNAHGVERVTSGAAGTYTFSIFIKKGTRRYAGMRAVVNGYSNRYFSLLDLDTGLIVSNNTVGTGVTWTSSVETYGNGWYRLIITGNHTSSNITLLAALSNSANPTYTAGVPYYQGSTSENGFFWGAQIELGAYATSYIPTLGAAVTRGADACSKTGISSLIGQTEGTLFVEFVNDGNNNTSIDRIISVSDGTANNRMYVARLSSGASYFVSVASGTQTGEITGTTMPQGVVKIALAYKNNDVAMYVNGSLIGTDTSHTTPATSNLYLGQENAGTTNNLWKPYKQAILFKTRLTNAQLAELTTI